MCPAEHWNLYGERPHFRTGEPATSIETDLPGVFRTDWLQTVSYRQLICSSGAVAKNPETLNGLLWNKFSPDTLDETLPSSLLVHIEAISCTKGGQACIAGAAESSWEQLRAVESSCSKSFWDSPPPEGFPGHINPKTIWNKGRRGTRRGDLPTSQTNKQPFELRTECLYLKKQLRS